MPSDCLDLLKLADRACLECCLSLESTSCYLKVTQKPCPDRPRLKFLLDTDVNQYYLVRIAGRFTRESSGLSVFAQSKEECPEIIQHRQLLPSENPETPMSLIFKFKAITPRTYIGFRFLDGQTVNQVELTKFEVCETQVVLSKPEAPLVIPITQRDIGCGDQLVLCQPGHYQLIEDVTFKCRTAILIDSCHVRLDLGGHRITGTGDQTAEAILIQKTGTQLQDITIENGRIECTNGPSIRVTQTKDATIRQLTVTKSKADGLLFIDTQKITIQGVHACYNAQAGYYVGPSNQYLTFIDSSAKANQTGFYLAGSFHQITNCQSLANETVGFYNEDPINTFYHNVAENNLTNFVGVALVTKPDCRSGYWINADPTADLCPGDCTKLISQSDVPYIIDSPGVYCLTENLQFATTDLYAIKIASSCVTLDLKDYCISQLDLKSPLTFESPLPLESSQVSNKTVQKVPKKPIQSSIKSVKSSKSTTPSNTPTSISMFGIDIQLPKTNTNTCRSGGSPIVQNFSTQVEQAVPTDIRLRAFDQEQDPLTYIVVTGPNHGTYLLNNSSGIITYTSNANYIGLDSLTYKVNDGTSDSNIATLMFEILPIASGICAGDPAIRYENICIKNGTIKQIQGAGLRITNYQGPIQCSNLKISDCLGIAGLVLDTCTEGLIDTCQFIDNKVNGLLINSSLFASSTVISSDLVIQNCQAWKNNIGFAVGQQIGQMLRSNNIFFKDCQANRQLTSNFNTSTGYLLIINDSQIHDSQANANGLGLVLAGADNQCRNLQAINNINIGVSTALDTNLQDPERLLFDACTTQANNLFGFVIDGNFHQIRGCQAINNTFGFVSINLNNQWLNNYASNNGSDYSLSIPNVLLSAVPAPTYWQNTRTL